MNRTLAGRGNSIMARHAVADDTNVIEHRGQPGHYVVAIVTLVVGRNMSQRLAGSLDAIVAAAATAGYRHMIHINGSRPACGDMTIGALAVCGDMIFRFRRCSHKAAL